MRGMLGKELSLKGGEISLKGQGTEDEGQMGSISFCHL